jgi:trypsin-like peptidase
MQKLLLATVCVIVLTAGAQAKPVQLASIDNRWVIEYESELFAGACIATTNFNLLKLKLSFITAYPKEGTEKLRIASYGFPYGADFASFTMGNVTSVVGLDNNTSAFQISAPVQPGNSGGPLLDMNGRVVGMAQGILGTLRAAEALGGAIPQNVNIGITATTIIGFLQAHSVDYRIDTERTKFEPEQIAEEAKKFTVKVTCGD